MEHKEIIITDEEKRWVKMLAAGRSTKEVSEEIGLRPGTFAYKLNMLRAKLQCENMASLIAYFYKNDLIE